MSIFGETVTLRNLTPKAAKVTLRVQYDGRRQDILPGDNPGFPKVAVRFAKQQNPVMGSEDPDDPTITGSRYLVAVVNGGEQGDDDPELTMEQWYAHLGKPSRINRELANLDLVSDKKKHEVLRGKPISAREARAHVGSFEADS